ncbi:MAG: C2 family cysteine protease [Thermoleophilia bacterium]
MTTTITPAEHPGEETGRCRAVISPYALAELVAGRRIDWRRVGDVPGTLEDILQTPYGELFDPVHAGPLYTGLRLDADLSLRPERSPLLDVPPGPDASDLEALPGERVERLADLAGRFATDDLGAIPVTAMRRASAGHLELTLRLPDEERLRRLARVLTPDLVRTVCADPGRRLRAVDWTPPGAAWSDPGRFFDEAAEFVDPVQGAVGNCHFVAALSAVAWARPYRIAHATRAEGLLDDAFTGVIRFYRPDSDGEVDRDVAVTDRVPQLPSGAFVYCRSSEFGEVWPAVYEKAYAKLLTGVDGDRPDITATAWGDCVLATARLTGGRRSHWETAGLTGEGLWDLVRANSLGGRTFNPMTAWTHVSAGAAEARVVYGDANLVAAHCYTVLGWAFRHGRRYLVLRNPWGATETEAAILGGTLWTGDVSWWRPMAPADAGGVFAIEADAFRDHFAGLGAVS